MATRLALTATITGSNAAPFSYGTYSIQLVDAAGNPVHEATIDGAAITPLSIQGVLSPTGSLSCALYANSAFSPQNTQWRFTLCSPRDSAIIAASSVTCFTQAVTITTAGDISAALSANAPAIYYLNLLTGDSYYSGGGGGDGVSSLNALTGALSLTSTGDTVSITPSGDTINLEVVGGGSGASFTLTAATDIAAGTGVSVNSSGQAQQTWGPAPNVAGVVTLIPASSLYVASQPGSFLVGVITPQDATHFLAWANTSGASTLALGLAAASVSGNTITVGTPSITPMGLYNLAALSDSAFVGIGYTVESPTLVSIAGTISALNITLGSATATSLAVANSNIIALGAAHFLALGAGSVGPNAQAGSVSGTTITLGDAVDVGSANIANPIAAALSSTTFVIAYEDAANNNSVTVVAGSISGTTITLGTPVVLAGFTSNSNMAIAELSSSSFVLEFFDNNSGPSMVAVAGSVSGTTASVGTPVALANYALYPSLYSFPGGGSSPQAALQIAVISSTQVAFTAGPSLPQVYTVSGTTLTPPLSIINVPASSPNSLFAVGSASGGNPAVINGVAAAGTSLVVVDGASNVYEVDQSTSDVSPYIQHATLTNYGLSPLSSGTVLAWFNDFSGNLQARIITVEPINVTPPVGITAAGASESGTVTVTPVGVVSGLSGLTPGVQYYYNGDGTITFGDTGHPAGVALTSSTLAVGAGS